MVNIDDIHPLLREMASEGEIDRHHKAAFLDAAQRPFQKEITCRIRIDAPKQERARIPLFH